MIGRWILEFIPDHARSFVSTHTLTLNVFKSSPSRYTSFCCSRLPPSLPPVDVMSGEKLSHSSSNEGKDKVQTTYVDLDEQRRAALSEIDNASFGSVHPPQLSLTYSLLHTIPTRWFHVKICLVAGVGFFTDAYVCSSLPYPSHLYLISAMTSSLSTLLPLCWAMCTAQVPSTSISS